MTHPFRSDLADDLEPFYPSTQPPPPVPAQPLYSTSPRRSSAFASDPSVPALGAASPAPYYEPASYFSLPASPSIAASMSPDMLYGGIDAYGCYQATASRSLPLSAPWSQTVYHDMSDVQSGDGWVGRPAIRVYAPPLPGLPPLDSASSSPAADAGSSSSRNSSRSPRTPRGPKRPAGAQRRRCECPVRGCGKSFTRTADLARHDMHVHGQDRSRLGIFCDYYPECPRKDPFFSRKDHLRQHLRDIHGDDIPKHGVNVHLSPAERQLRPRSVSDCTSVHRPPSPRRASIPDGILRRRLNTKLESDSPAASPRDDSDPVLLLDDADALADDAPPDITWWRCSPCLARVPCFPGSPDEQWECPGCHNVIEPDRRLARERAVAEKCLFET